MTAEEAIAEDLAYMTAGADPDGCRPAGSEFATVVGFTAERFDGYLWLSSAVCWLSLVVSREPGRGHLSEVLRRLTACGFEIRVPNPTVDMRAILALKGFSPMPEDPLTWTRAEDLPLAP